MRTRAFGSADDQPGIMEKFKFLFAADEFRRRVLKDARDVSAKRRSDGRRNRGFWNRFWNNYYNAAAYLMSMPAFVAKRFFGPVAFLDFRRQRVVSR